MTYHALRWPATLIALLLTLAAATPGVMATEALEVVDVRVDGYPRVVVRLKVNADGDAPIPVLGPEHLRVVEDGKPQPGVDLFQIRSVQAGTSVVLALDTSGSMAEQDRLPQAREAAKTFLSQLRPRDRAALVSFGSQVGLRQAFTSDRRPLFRAIDGLTVAGNTRLYDALARSVEMATSTAAGSRAVIVLTDGEDTESSSTIEAPIELASRAGVPVYTIGLGSEIRADVLQRLASETGGRFYHAPGSGDLAGVFRLISRQLASQYEVFWISKTKREAGYEVPVQIQLTAPGAVGEARLSYRMPSLGRAEETLTTVNAQELSMVPGSAPPNDDLVVLAGLLAALCAAVLYGAVVLPRVNRRIQARLATYVAGRPGPGAAAVLAGRRVDLMPLTAASAGLASRLLPTAMLIRIRRALIHGGLRTERHFQMFLAALVLIPLMLGGMGLLLLRIKADAQISPMAQVGLPVMLVALGAFLPVLWLRRRIRARQKAMFRALPDALDLMTIGVTAGLSLDGAMLEIIEKWETELSNELALVLHELRMGVGRREALYNLAERTQLEDIRLLVASLIQADELGTGVAETLSVQAEQLRIRRRQLAEEMARKAPVKMLFPLVFLIFPALFVVILAPAMLQIMQSLGGIAR